MEKRPAFTMIELIFVIVVLGILASLAIPRLDRDLRQGAKDNILAAIRYTQHLALVDDKTDPRDPKWQQELWTIRFASYTDSGDIRWFYTISTNIDHGSNVDMNETAIDPLNGKYIYNAAGDSIIDVDESPNLFIGKKYGVNDINLSTECGDNQYIAFDHLGRPFKNSIFSASAPPPFDGYMTADCTITVGFEDSSIDDIVFTIEKETGYVSAI